jgi:hypothetical protein
MRLARTAVSLLAVFGLTVGLNGQAGVPNAPVRTSQRHHVIGGFKVESVAAGRTRIELWLNTRTYLAYGAGLEADSFRIKQEANGGVLIDSTGPVRVTGFMLGQDINNGVVLEYAQGHVLTWEQGFKLRILADGGLEWGCCPRKG